MPTTQEVVVRRGKGGLTVLVPVGAAATALALAVPANGASTGHGPSVKNPYSPAYGHAYRHGVVPTTAQQSKMKNWAKAHPGAINATGPETLTYGGGVDGIGVTSGTPKVYLVFWGTQWGTQSTDASGNLTFSSDTAGGAPYIQK